MSSSKDVIADILDALAPLRVRARAMFGEHGIHCDEKFVALVCDDRLSLEHTRAADAFLDSLEPCSPFPGAKDWLVLGERFQRERPCLGGLVQATADALPAPGPRKRRQSRSPGRKA